MVSNIDRKAAVRPKSLYDKVIRVHICFIPCVYKNQQLHQTTSENSTDFKQIPHTFKEEHTFVHRFFDADRLGAHCCRKLLNY
jgi:hypothetical protein